MCGPRAKLIHSQGVVAKVKLDVTNGDSPFTGLFKSGADYGLIRLSLAGKASTTHMTPGFGLKFLRDGIDSANLVAMYRLAGQDNLNFFANDFSNHIPGETS
jgi:hypothetical protein